MRIDVGEVVLRGAEPGARICDGCKQRGGELRECRIVTVTHGARKRFGYWRDLCRPCQVILKGLPDFPKEAPQIEKRWEAALDRLRSAGTERAENAAGRSRSASGADQGSRAISPEKGR